jgi:5-methylcytosine-specific restriction endonuclease McrA
MTDVGTTPRKKLTPRQRLAIWERDKGICCLCSHPIDGVRQKWIVEHLRALELGGTDTDDNMGVAHVACADGKTHGKSGDHSMAAKAKRQKRRHIGIKETKNPLPGGKGSKWKKKVGGGVVPRD